MTFPCPSSRTRPAWAALLAAFALLAQGLWPASAMPTDSGLKVQMCTPHGLQEQSAPGHPSTPAADCCGVCVLGAAAVLSEVQTPSVAVRYALRVAAYDATVEAPAPRARGPPRPPSQGPPSEA